MIDFSQVLLSIDGETPLREAGGDNATELTLRAAAVFALVRPYEDEKGIGPQQTWERGVLAQRIHLAKKPIKLKSEEISQLKNLIAKSFGPAVTVASWPLLDKAMRVPAEEAE